MYSIFSTKSRKRKYLPEGEPPVKACVSDKELLIKELAQKQRKTDINLSEQLSKTKAFSTNKECLTDIGAHVQGETSLKSFTLLSDELKEENRLKSAGLSERDIEIYQDDSTLNSEEFWLKHNQVNRDILEQQLNSILELVEKIHSRESREAQSLPFTEETPLDALPELEKNFMNTIAYCTKSDLKKIRRKARMLGQDLEALSSEKSIPITVKEAPEKLNRKTLWDVSEPPLITKNRDSQKIYGCASQKLYTIKDGKIMALEREEKKLSVEEIRSNPKFSDYKSGSPAKSLFLKNLSKGVTEELLSALLKDAFSPEDSYTIKLMKGKMRGQAFIEFQDETQACKGLDILNGTIIQGKPMIVMYSTRKV